MSISNTTYYVGSGKTTFLDLLTGRRKYGTVQVSVTNGVLLWGVVIFCVLRMCVHLILYHCMSVYIYIYIYIY